MVLEATVVVLDNSEWMRNGDYVPSRLDAQQDAAHLICNTKRQANVENAVAIMAMAGPSPKVLVTLTSEQSKLQHALASTRFEGSPTCNLASALQVAQLVLKNRQNANQRQRIVVFLGSPLCPDAAPADSVLASLGTIGRMLRKNGVALDVISFGHVEQNASAVATILTAVGGLDPAAGQKNIHEALLDPNCECHLLTVNGGESIAEALMTSPILLDADGSAPMGEFGMDGDMDPELAMALKLSLEEEKARLERESGNSSRANEPGAHPHDMILETQQEQQHSQKHEGDDEDDESTMMARAIAMSLETATQEAKDSRENNGAPPV